MTSTRSQCDKAKEIANVFQTKEFKQMISEIVQAEMQHLQQKIDDLTNEVKVLRESNIDLVKVLTKNNTNPNAKCSINNEISGKILLSEQVSVTDKVSEDSDNLPPKILNLGSSISKQEDKNIIAKPTDNRQKEPWNIIARKQRPNKRSIIGNVEPNDTIKFKSVSKRESLFISRLDAATEIKDIVQHLAKTAPEVTCEKLTSKYPTHYSSFKVTVNAQNLDTILDANQWPKGVYVTKFFYPRRQNQPPT